MRLGLVATLRDAPDLLEATVFPALRSDARYHALLAEVQETHAALRAAPMDV